MTDLIRSLLNHIHGNIGQNLAVLYSSVTHGGLMGLMGNLERVERGAQLTPLGYEVARLTVSSSSVNTALGALIFGFTRAATMCQGFTDVRWPGWPELAQVIDR